MYRKKTLELKDVRQMLQNNELMKKINFIEGASRLVVKKQRRRGGDHGVKDPRKILKLLAKTMIATIANNKGT